MIGFLGVKYKLNLKEGDKLMKNKSRTIHTTDRSSFMDNFLKELFDYSQEEKRKNEAQLVEKIKLGELLQLA